MADQLPLQEPLIQFLPGKIRLVLLPVAVGDLAEALGTGKRHVRRKVPQIPRDGYVPAAAVGDITIDYSAREVHARGEKIHFNRKELSTNN